jgi:hypothetical protein
MVYQNALVSCTCTADHCADACAATLCAPTVLDADAACLECLSHDDECMQQVDVACQADADCPRFDRCIVDSCLQ